jgi:hypothetical protein
LRRTKINGLLTKDAAVEGVKDETETKEDISMADDQAREEDIDDEPKERGSEAVERRVEKVLTEMREQGLVDINDEKALQAKKVCSFQHSFPIHL